MKPKSNRWPSLLGRTLIVVTLALAGWALMRVSAATLSATQEAENGVRTSLALACPDATASASASVRFGAGNCTPTGRTFTNPVKLDTADPTVMAWNGKYYMVNTADTSWFVIYESDDMVNWHAAGNVFSFQPAQHPWGKDRFWAPELHRVGNRFAVYYSAGDGTTTRIGAAFSDTITGPYTELGHPLISESYGVIDVNFFQEDNGKQYLLWKEDKDNTRIFCREIASDGVTFIGNTTTLLQKTLAWEGIGIEGPWLMKKNGMYYLFYSGNFFADPNYGVGVARSSNLLGPYTKKGDPIMKAGNRWKGPGHNSVVTIGVNDYMVYHAWDKVAGQGQRAGMVDKITWSGGWPSVGNGTPTETAQPYPN